MSLSTRLPTLDLPSPPLGHGGQEEEDMAGGQGFHQRRVGGVTQSRQHQWDIDGAGLSREMPVDKQRGPLLPEPAHLVPVQMLR